MPDTIDKLTKENGQSLNIEEQNIQQLKELFPDVFKEGKIDFDSLKAVLGEHVENQEERYNFTWHGKNKARQIAQTPSTGTLRPCKEESVDWDTTQNLFIEGDNLEVLKLLQKSYHKKVKMIYIDPPYNTGKDFVYKDNFRDNINNYLEITGQIDSEGKKLSANTESSGRYHTDWLNMMYPRLKLARNLLKDNGVIFISIDEHEITNLKKICDEIFGEDNNLGVISNTNNPKGRSDDKYIATAHEYIAVYSKDKNFASFYGFEPDDKIIKRYNKKDKNNRVYREIDLRKTGDSDRREDRPDMFYYFYYNQQENILRISKEQDTDTDEIEIKPIKNDGNEGRWRWGYLTASNKISTVYPKFMPSRKIWGIFEMDYLDGRPPVKSTSSWTFKDVNSERGSEQFIDLNFDKEIFQRPKPLGTLRRVIELGSINNGSEIILDFFAGSSGIAQALFELQVNGKRKNKFILVQLPEICIKKSEAYEAGYSTIAEISKERIRRAGNKIKEDNPNFKGDIGFKAFKLDKTNINQWEANFDNLSDMLDSSQESIKSDRSPEDVLYEILLKYGLDLTYPIKEHSIAGKTVFDVAFGSLIVCLDNDISMDVVEGIGKLIKDLDSETTRVVFKDFGFANDAVKVNAFQILKQYGIDDVKSI